MALPKNPTIRVLFTGLMAFHFDRHRRYCRVAFHSQAPDHRFSVKVHTVTPDSFRTIDITNDVRGHDIRLQAVYPRFEGIRFYQDGPFTRDDEDDVNDFRWLVDIEGQEFHNRALRLKSSNVLKPVFHLNNGLFHTAVKSFVRVFHKGKERDCEIALTVGANIYLDDADSEAFLIFGPGGCMSMRLKKSRGTTYKIVIKNNRPPHHISKSERKQPEHDFLLYYKAFDVLEEDQFDMIGPDEVGPRADRLHPCGPIKTSKSS